MNPLIELKPEAHSKAEISSMVASWIADNANPALMKYIALKELEIAVEEGLKTLKEPAKQNYLEIAEGALDKKQLYGVKVEAISNVKKVTLAKEYIFSNAVDAMQENIKELEKQLEDKKAVLKATKVMEINNGTAIELTGQTDEVVPIEKTFDLRITFRK